MTRELGILSWTETFTDYLSETVEYRYIPLVYVIRSQDIIIVTDRAALAHKRSHITVNSSVIADLIIYTTHDYPLYTENNRQVYFDLEKTLRGTVYVSFL